MPLRAISSIQSTNRHETINVNLVDSPDWIRERNPAGQLPIIEFGPDNKVLYESLIVCQYLDETYAETRPLQSRDPYQKARDQVFVELFSNLWAPASRPFFMSADLSADWLHIVNGFKKFDNLLATREGRSNFYQPGLVDYMIWPSIERLPLFVDIAGHNGADYLRRELPTVHNYWEQMSGDTTVQSARLPVETFIENLRTFGDPYPPRLNPDVMRVYSQQNSPFAYRVLMVLTAKQIEHEIININIWDKPEWFLERSPLGKVPVVEMGPAGDLLNESLIIADYLDETIPGARPLASPDPYQRASDRAFVETIGQYFVGLEYVFTKSDLAALWPEIEVNLAKANNMLDKRLNGDKYLSGADKPGLTDYKIAPFVHLLPLCVDLLGHNSDEYFRDKLPVLYTYRKAIQSDPVVNKVVTPYDEFCKITDEYHIRSKLNDDDRQKKIENVNSLVLLATKVEVQLTREQRESDDDRRGARPRQVTFSPSVNRNNFNGYANNRPQNQRGYLATSTRNRIFIQKSQYSA
ncbi:unnamed protein product [Medioppia subpectinata]|uniref:Glutathione S-transferase n=1 Tax=Medioppia subpectinata TaxID=1979941 RepID=A0A7R9PV93_9ACAR|nr:unnamed protein product [Medioppia subpectinata]CAG2102581.1 unnamed protein product [Medioppia subpectinata]